MRLSWGPPRSCRPQVGPMLAPWTLLSGQPLFLVLGTEMRQSTLYDPSGTTPDSLKESLEDPGMLRWHVLDGDIEEITMAACFEMPPVDGTTGKVIPSECGGRRRVDYVLTRKEDNVVSVKIQNKCCLFLIILSLMYYINARRMVQQASPYNFVDASFCLQCLILE